jgi:hypothetical protein
MTGTTSGACTAYSSRAPEFSVCFSGVRVTRSLVLFVRFVDRCLSFFVCFCCCFVYLRSVSCVQCCMFFVVASFIFVLCLVSNVVCFCCCFVYLRSVSCVQCCIFFVVASFIFVLCLVFYVVCFLLFLRLFWTQDTEQR